MKAYLVYGVVNFHIVFNKTWLDKKLFFELLISDILVLISNVL